MRAAQAGSDAAFARLVEAHQAGLRAFLRRIMLDHPDEADDVAQECFLAAWTHLSRLRDASGFRAWLFGIAWRKAQDRRRGRRRAASRDGAWLDHSAPAAESGPEVRLALKQAMATLEPDARASLALCLAAGWSHEEAATALGLALGTVKSHVRRGRARLLAVIGGSDDS